jgi:uroporphyrinogen-III synthase
MRVLLTRPLEDSPRTAARLTALGCIVTVSPVLQTAPATFELPADPFDAIIATSARALRYGERILTDYRSLPLWLVGERAALEARALGCARIETVAPDSRELSARLIARPDELRWLYLAGSPRSDVIERALQSAGRSLRTIVVYETRATDALTEETIAALRAGAIDAVLHYSPLSARAFIDLARAAGVENESQRPAHVAISSRAAAPLRAMPVVRIAHSPSEDAIIDSLFQGRRSDSLEA